MGWLTGVIGLLVCLFGVFRLNLSRRSGAEQARAAERGGLDGMPRRRHALFGIVYLLMGGMLIANAFGVRLY